MKNGSIGFFGLLQIVFIVLKLVNVITWSWWLVLIPTWFSIAIPVLALLVYGITLLIAYIKIKF